MLRVHRGWLTHPLDPDAGGGGLDTQASKGLTPSYISNSPA